MNKANLLREGPVFQAICSIAVPMAVVMAVSALFNYLDIWYISRLGADALHAMDILFPYINLSSALIYGGLGTGVSVAVARQCTARNDFCASTCLKAGLLLAIPISLFFTAGVLFGKDVLFRAAANENSRQMAWQYSFWYFLFIPVMAFGSVISAAMRGIGNAVRPAVYSVSCILFKALLTPLLSFKTISFWFVECSGLGMGMTGAAIATVISYSVFCLLLVNHLLHGSHGRWAARAGLKPAPSVFKGILKSGAIAAQVPILASIVLLLVLNVMGERNASLADAFSLAKRFELYLIQLTVCLGCGVMVAMSASRDNENTQRIQEILQVALKILFGLGIPLMVLMFFYSDVFYKSLTSSPGIVIEGRKYFTWGGLNMLFTLGFILLNFSFQGIGRPARPFPFLLFSVVLIQGGGGWLLRSEQFSSTGYYVLISAGSAAAFFLALRAFSKSMVEHNDQSASVALAFPAVGELTTLYGDEYRVEYEGV